MKIAVVAALAAVLVAAGCSKRSDAFGSGPDVDACTAYFVYDQFAEPSPVQSDELLAYAEGLIRVTERVRADYRITVEDKDDFTPPEDVVAAWATVKRSMERLRDDARAAGDDPARLRAAANALAADTDYLAADARITDFFVNECPRE